MAMPQRDDTIEAIELLNELDETDSLEAKSLNACKMGGSMV